MEREHLIAALTGAGEAATLCRQALLDDAELVMSPSTVPTADRLDRTAHAELAVARVDGGPGGHVFQLFLDPARQQVVACLAVPGVRE